MQITLFNRVARTAHLGEHVFERPKYSSPSLTPLSFEHVVICTWVVAVLQADQGSRRATHLSPPIPAKSGRTGLKHPSILRFESMFRVGTALFFSKKSANGEFCWFLDFTLQGRGFQA